jgi:hypothetical protein
MKEDQENAGTNEENALAQEYYDLAVIKLKPKIEKYLNVDVSKKDLKQRIEELRKDYIGLNAIQYRISQVPRGRILQYKKEGEAKPEDYEVEGIDIQAQNWLSRLSAAISFMVIKQSEFDVKISFRRDIIICIISIILSILSGVLIS